MFPTIPSTFNPILAFRSYNMKYLESNPSTLFFFPPDLVPDFRSPGTGLYNNLARLKLPHPEAVFDIDFFEENPYPFYLLAKELYPGNFQPTISHVFVALLARKNLLRLLFTQNIDCLERTAGVPADLIVEAHGSFATQRCVDCKTPFPDADMREHVAKGEPAACPVEGCMGIVKPDIVFFGEQLPAAFFENKAVPAAADLLLVLGTSLSVQPFASLPLAARDGVPRVLFNLQRVGDLGSRPDDVLCLGDCDSGVRQLADALGWREELESMWEDLIGKEEADKQRSRIQTGNPTTAADLDNEVQAMANQLLDKLKLGPTSSSSSSLPPPRPLPTQDWATLDIGTDHHRGQGQGRDDEFQPGQGKEKEELGRGENHDEDGRHPHAPHAPERAAPGAASGSGEASAPASGGGGVAGGFEAEDPGAKTDDEAAPSSGAVAPPPQPPPKKKVMIATENNTVIEPPPAEIEKAEEAGEEVSSPSPPLMPHLVPDDAVAPTCYASPAAANTHRPSSASSDGAAQPLETLPALNDPPREVKRSGEGGSDGGGGGGTS